MFVIRYHKFFYIFSAVMITASIFAFWYFGFDFSIEFKGGSLLEIAYENNAPTVKEIQKQLISQEFKEIKALKNLQVQSIGENKFLLRFGDIDEPTHQKIVKALADAKELQFQTIGPVIGEELTKRTILGLVLAIFGMFFYVAGAFRKIAGKIPWWKMSGAAILALIHDIFITAGGFIIIGYYYGFEIGILFVAAELTIWGYSINDTIVVFDRLRENLLREGKKNIEEIAGASISQTLARSINTSTAVLLLLIVLLVFGPSPLFPFIVPLIIGVIIGTYSSICIAVPLLISRKLA